MARCEHTILMVWQKGIFNKLIYEYRLETDNKEITLQRLTEIVDTIPARFRKYSKKELARKPDPDHWSKK